MALSCKACNPEPAGCPPCFPSCPVPKAHPTTLGNGIWLLPSSWLLVINAQKLPLAARFIKLPVAGYRPETLPTRSLISQTKNRSSARARDTCHTSRAATKVRGSPGALQLLPGTEKELQLFSRLLLWSGVGVRVGGSWKRNPELSQAVVILRSCYSPA